MADTPDDTAQALYMLMRSTASAAVYEAMGKSGDLDATIQPLVPGAVCVGFACTARSDNSFGDDAVAALDAAPAGAVLVFDLGEGADACTWGGSATEVAQRRGVAGCLTNGYVRDLREIRAAGFPVFARGVALRGTRSAATGALGVPVQVGGRRIAPGDLVCADDDGVVVVPQARFASVLAGLRKRLDFEARVAQRIAEGASYAVATGRAPANQEAA